MNIGIDAYYLYSAKTTGIGNYVLTLILGLSKIDHKNTYYLFTPGIRNHALAKEITKNPGFNIITCDNIFKKYKRLWMQHPQISRQVSHNKIDIFLGGGEHIPLLGNHTTQFCLTVCDAVYKIYPETVSTLNKILCNTLLQWCIKKANYIFTISETSKREISSYMHIPAAKITAIPIGIRIDNYTPRKTIKKKNFILFVGTIQPRKNLINLLKAYVLMHDKIKQDLVIVGASGWKNSKLASYIGTIPLNIRKRIIFKGYIDDSTLLSLYKQAELFVLPTLHEGFGLIVLEAMASGTPVVTSKSGAIPELFSKAVLFADPHSPEDIAAKILDVIKKPSTKNAMIRKGLSLAKRFDHLIVARDYLDAFNNIKKSRGL